MCVPHVILTIPRESAHNQQLYIRQVTCTIDFKTDNILMCRLFCVVQSLTVTRGRKKNIPTSFWGCFHDLKHLQFFQRHIYT